MKVSDVIGKRVREVRVAHNMSQRELGKRLQEVLGRTWSAQAVSAAEKGGRSWAAEDLVAVAWVLDCALADLFTVPEKDASTILDLPGTERGVAIPASWMSGVAVPRIRTPEELAATIEQAARELRRFGNARTETGTKAEATGTKAEVTGREGS